MKLLGPCFYWDYNKNRFASALMRCGDPLQIQNPFVLYACYRLGMYKTVANTDLYTGGNWRGGFARAVSLSACGRHEEAREQVDLWLGQKVTEEQQANLAVCLAPFHSQLAYDILKNISAPISLSAAILLRVGQRQGAVALLEGHLASLSENLNPESYLYFSNASVNLSTQNQLDYLNSFLAAHGVPQLELIDKTVPPGPLNLQPAGSFVPVDGPLVSVLMTAYNSEERIEIAIRSVLNQTYQDIELIVVDDASVDNTAELVRNLASQDSRIKFICLPRNVGTYVAKNIGMKCATGEFATCHDSDDWAHPVKIERQVTPLLSDKKLVFTTSHWVRMQDDGTYYARAVHPLTRINPASPLFRRQLVIDKTGLWDPVRTGADSEFLARLKLVFGRKAMKRIVQPLTLGSHCLDSLMTSKETGYSAEGLSPTRLNYWEAWNRWHIDELRAKRKPELQSFEEGRSQFKAPEGIVVPQGDIEYCVKHVQIYEAR